MTLGRCLDESWTTLTFGRFLNDCWTTVGWFLKQLRTTSRLRFGDSVMTLVRLLDEVWTTSKKLLDDVWTTHRWTIFRSHPKDVQTTSEWWLVDVLYDSWKTVGRHLTICWKTFGRALDNYWTSCGWLLYYSSIPLKWILYIRSISFHTIIRTIPIHHKTEQPARVAQMASRHPLQGTTPSKVCMCNPH